MNSLSLRRLAAFVTMNVAANALLIAVGLLATQGLVHAQGNETVARAVSGRNAYAAGGSVRLAVPIEGDYMVAGGSVTIDQPVKGDALVIGGSIDVRGPIGDDLRIAGGNLNVASTVGGELVAAGGNVVLGPAAQVEQGAFLNGGHITIDGKVIGKLKANAQRIVLNGEVTGDARLVAAQIELGPKARIGGTLSHASREFKQADTAVVAGAVTRDESASKLQERSHERHREWRWDSGRSPWAGRVLGYFGLLAAGALWVLLFPKFSAAAPDEIRRSPGLSLAIGLGVLVGVPVLAVLLFISLLGIPLGIAAFALYPLLLLLGYLAGVLFVAQRARQTMPSAAAPTLRNTIGFVALALLVVMLVSWLPVVGPLAVFVTTIAGLGACVLEWHRRRQGPPAVTP
jgi:cytoskeletal protein CcmA (bactofilin family)